MNKHYALCVKCRSKFFINTKYCMKCYLNNGDKNLLTDVSDYTKGNK